MDMVLSCKFCLDNLEVTLISFSIEVNDIHALQICLHGWFWSAAFHTRDKDFTEVMDYSCAFTIVLTLFYCLLLRYLN